MKFSAQEEYGLRCMLQIARRLHDEKESKEGHRSLTIGEIAEIEGITPQYAGKLIRILRMGGLLESVRGRHGGYRIAKPLEKISVGEVLAVLGGRVFQPGYCSRYGGERKICVHSVDCTLRSLWSAIQQTVDRILSRVLLVDLLKTEKGIAQWLAPVAQSAAETFAASSGDPACASATAAPDGERPVAALPSRKESY